MSFKRTLVAMAAMASALGLAGAASAAPTFQSTFQGATFTVTPISSTEFTFDISDSTGLSGDWSTATFLDAFAFGTNFVSGPTAGITANGTGAAAGGLDAGGCNGAGAFFCFDFDPNLAVAKDMSFDVKAPSGTTFNFGTLGSPNAPDLKIDWSTTAETGTDTPGKDDADPHVGSLYSQSLSVAVPEPATWALMLFGVGAIGATMRASRRNAATLATA